MLAINAIKMTSPCLYVGSRVVLSNMTPKEYICATVNLKHRMHDFDVVTRHLI